VKRPFDQIRGEGKKTERRDCYFIRKTGGPRGVDQPDAGTGSKEKLVGFGEGL